MFVPGLKTSILGPLLLEKSFVSKLFFVIELMLPTQITLFALPGVLPLC